MAASHPDPSGRLAALDSEPADAHRSSVDPADKDDIRASLRGDGEAYARLVRRHQQKVAARMRTFARDRGTIEELVQEVFVEAYFSLARYRGEAPLEHWLNRIGTRVGYRHWKRQRRQSATKSLESWDGAAEAQEHLAPEQAEELVHGLLGQLPPRDRLVLTLLYLEERSVAEAAAQIGWSKTMVKVQAFRARGKLRKLLEKS